MKNAIVMFGLVLLSVFVVTESRAEPFVPNQDGFIQDWLICGPFPNPGDHEQAAVFSGWEKDWLSKDGGEEKIEPKPGMFYEVTFPDVMCSGEGKTFRAWNAGKIEVEWQKFYSQTPRVDLLPVFISEQLGIDEVQKPAGFVVGYFACAVETASERDVTFAFGSDDGYKIWLNHTLVGARCVRRGSEPDQDKFPVHLKAGRNLLLIKVDQSLGGYNFYARFLDAAGKPAADLKIWYTK